MKMVSGLAELESNAPRLPTTDYRLHYCIKKLVNHWLTSFYFYKRISLYISPEVR